jgi:hypothetical protein
MARKSATNADMAPYGIGIGNALSKNSTTTEELIAWRNHARDIVGAQGDLVAALKALDAEIARRNPKSKAAPQDGERFVALVEGLAIPSSVATEIEKAIERAVLNEIAKLDTGGDIIATPLSQISAFGSGPGAHTRGRYISLKSLRSS